jgi:gluconate 2-dehydrogenase gamma chain
MESQFRFNRRAFLQAALAASAAAGTGVACSKNHSPWRFFSVDEARCLAALCDQIIPPDQDPGASWAGVLEFIDRQLCGPYENLRTSYRRGLAGVDESSRVLYGKVFPDLESGQQIELMHRLEDGKASGAIWKERSSAEFFGYVVDHTMQGFYGDPRHGGNRDGVSWKMLGLPYPPIRGRIRIDHPKDWSR